MKLLLIEDDTRLLNALSAALRAHGFTVLCGHTAAQALDLISHQPDAVLLDVGLPDGDGFAVCGEIRRTSGVPVIMVTSWYDVGSRVKGLNIGADDYLVKPFNVVELIARIHAVTRRERTAAQLAERVTAPTGGILPVGPLRIDTDARSVTVYGRPVPLSRKEYDLLALLARRAGAVVSRDRIRAAVWPGGGGGSQGSGGAGQGGAGQGGAGQGGAGQRGAGQRGGHTLEVHVAALRQKLGVPGLVATVRGVGYRLDAPPADPE